MTEIVLLSLGVAAVIWRIGPPVLALAGFSQFDSQADAPTADFEPERLDGRFAVSYRKLQSLNFIPVGPMHESAVFFSSQWYWICREQVFHNAEHRCFASIYRFSRHEPPRLSFETVLGNGTLISTSNQGAQVSEPVDVEFSTSDILYQGAVCAIDAALPESERRLALAMFLVSTSFADTLAHKPGESRGHERAERTFITDKLVTENHLWFMVPESNYEKALHWHRVAVSAMSQTCGPPIYSSNPDDLSAADREVFATSSFRNYIRRCELLFFLVAVFFLACCPVIICAWLGFSLGHLGAGLVAGAVADAAFHGYCWTFEAIRRRRVWRQIFSTESLKSTPEPAAA